MSIYKATMNGTVGTEFFLEHLVDEFPDYDAEIHNKVYFMEPLDRKIFELEILYFAGRVNIMEHLFRKVSLFDPLFNIRDRKAHENMINDLNKDIPSWKTLIHYGGEKGEYNHRGILIKRYS
jgi:hypothetical protein